MKQTKKTKTESVSSVLRTIEQAQKTANFYATLFRKYSDEIREELFPRLIKAVRREARKQIRARKAL